MNRAHYVLAVLAICSLFAGTASADVIATTGGWKIEVPGWAADENSKATLVEDAGNEDVLVLELFKAFYGTVGDFGEMPSINISFIRMKDVPSVNTIVIADETIQNLMDVDWVDFHMYLLASPETTFDVQNLDTDKFAGMTASAQQIDLYDGVVAAQSTLYLGSGVTNNGGQIVINVDPNEGSFVLKEIPSIPEPATMSLLAMGGIAVLRRRRR